MPSAGFKPVEFGTKMQNLSYDMTLILQIKYINLAEKMFLKASECFEELSFEQQ